MFDLASMQDATENCHCSELIGEPLRLELNFTFPMEHVPEVNVVGERTSLVAVDKFGDVEKIKKMDKISLLQKINCNSLLRYRYFRSFPSYCLPTFDNNTFAIINTHPWKMHGDHWMMIAKFCL